MGKIEIKEIAPFKVAALSVRSSRSKEEEYFKQLLKWLKQRGIQPRKKLTIFHSKPYELNTNNTITYEVCFEIKDPVEKDERVQIKELPEQKMATITHTPYEKTSLAYETLLEWIKSEGYAIEGPPREIYAAHPNSKDKGSPKDYVAEIQFPIGGRKLTDRLSTTVESSMFPHLLVIIQWLLLLTGIMSFLNFPLIIPGSTANGELKVIMASHLWVLLFSTVLCYLFYRHWHRGLADKWIVGISMMTALFSIANFALHFINNFLLLMWTMEIIAWTFYLMVFTTSLYKILVKFISSASSRVTKT